MLLLLETEFSKSNQVQQKLARRDDYMAKLQRCQSSCYKRSRMEYTNPGDGRRFGLVKDENPQRDLTQFQGQTDQQPQAQVGSHRRGESGLCASKGLMSFHSVVTGLLLGLEAKEFWSKEGEAKRF